MVAEAEDENNVLKAAQQIMQKRAASQATPTPDSASIKAVTHTGLTELLAKLQTSSQ